MYNISRSKAWARLHNCRRELHHLTFNNVTYPCRQKICKETVHLDYTLGSMDLINLYRTLHSTAAEFPSAHETFSRRDHMLGHKTNLNNFKITKIISSVFSKHNAMQLEISNRRNFGRLPNMWNVLISLILVVKGK
jgi:hypothetical protein